MAFALAGYALWVLSNMLTRISNAHEEGRNNDRELIKEFADRFMAKDFKDFETHQNFREKQVELVKNANNMGPTKRPMMPESTMAIDSVTRGL